MKDSLTRGWYYINKNTLEDPTTFMSYLTQKSNITEYRKIEKFALEHSSKKNFNYSDPLYSSFEGEIADIEFSNGLETTKIKLK